VPCGSSLCWQAKKSINKQSLGAGNKLDGRRVRMRVSAAPEMPLSSPMVAAASGSTDASDASGSSPRVDVKLEGLLKMKLQASECSRKLPFSKPPSPANRTPESRPCEFSTGRVVKI
jgi:hypothetical protein